MEWETRGERIANYARAWLPIVAFGAALLAINFHWRHGQTLRNPELDVRYLQEEVNAPETSPDRRWTAFEALATTERGDNRCEVFVKNNKTGKLIYLGDPNAEDNIGVWMTSEKFIFYSDREDTLKGSGRRFDSYVFYPETESVTLLTRHTRSYTDLFVDFNKLLLTDTGKVAIVGLVGIEALLYIANRKRKKRGLEKAGLLPWMNVLWRHVTSRKGAYELTRMDDKIPYYARAGSMSVYSPNEDEAIFYAREALFVPMPRVLSAIPTAPLYFIHDQQRICERNGDEYNTPLRVQSYLRSIVSHNYLDEYDRVLPLLQDAENGIGDGNDASQQHLGTLLWVHAIRQWMLENHDRIPPPLAYCSFRSLFGMNRVGEFLDRRVLKKKHLLPPKEEIEAANIATLGKIASTLSNLNVASVSEGGNLVIHAEQEERRNKYAPSLFLKGYKTKEAAERELALTRWVVGLHEPCIIARPLGIHPMREFSHSFEEQGYTWLGMYEQMAGETLRELKRVGNLSETMVRQAAYRLGEYQRRLTEMARKKPSQQDIPKRNVKGKLGRNIAALLTHLPKDMQETLRIVELSLYRNLDLTETVVTHGDYHLGNILFNKEATRCCILDHESLCKTHPLDDLSWFVSQMQDISLIGAAIDAYCSSGIWKRSKRTLLSEIVPWYVFSVVRALGSGSRFISGHSNVEHPVIHDLKEEAMKHATCLEELLKGAPPLSITTREIMHYVPDILREMTVQPRAY